MKGYSIKCHRSTPNGFVKETLGKDSIWYVACNNASFKTLQDAQKFFLTSTYELRGSSVWIEGPKGGCHKLFNKRG